MLQARGRSALVKDRVVRHMRSPVALRAHIGYLKREVSLAMDRPANWSMPPETMRRAARSTNPAKETGTISGSSSRRTVLASYRGCEALRRKLRFRGPMRKPQRAPLIDSKRPQKIDDCLPVGHPQMVECIDHCVCLGAGRSMGLDRLEQIAGPAVVKEEDPLADAP